MSGTNHGLITVHVDADTEPAFHVSHDHDGTVSIRPGTKGAVDVYLNGTLGDLIAWATNLRRVLTLAAIAARGAEAE